MKNNLSDLGRCIPFSIKVGETNLSKYLNLNHEVLITKIKPGLHNIIVNFNDKQYKFIVNGVVIDKYNNNASKNLLDIRPGSRGYKAVSNLMQMDILERNTSYFYGIERPISLVEAFSKLSKLFVYNDIVSMKTDRDSVFNMLGLAGRNHIKYYEIAHLLTLMNKDDALKYRDKLFNNHNEQLTRDTLYSLIYDLIKYYNIDTVKQYIPSNLLKKLPEDTSYIMRRGMTLGYIDWILNSNKILNKLEFTIILDKLHKVLSKIN